MIIIAITIINCLLIVDPKLNQYCSLTGKRRLRYVKIGMSCFPWNLDVSPVLKNCGGNNEDHEAVKALMGIASEVGRNNITKP